MESGKHDDIKAWLIGHPELQGLEVIAFDFHSDFHMWFELKHQKLIKEVTVV